MRLSLQIPNFSYGTAVADLFPTVVAQAREAEAAGFDAVFVMDHFYQLPMLGAPDDNMLEAYTLLSALAARTSRVRLGCMVGGMTYRNPAMLAKMVTTLDVISGGRAIWGIGAGWFEQEHDGYGYEFGTFTDRFEKLEEGLQIAKSMFVDHATSFDGKWFTVRNAFNTPKPIQAGGPPVLIGGSGERKTLRMVAQYGDACNLFGSPSAVRRLLGVLDEHCERLGRDPGEICRTRLGTVSIAPTMEQARAKAQRRIDRLGALPADDRERLLAQTHIGDPDTIGEQMQAFEEAGLDGMVCNTVDVTDHEALQLLGGVLRRVFG